jgi:hypothetical protein
MYLIQNYPALSETYIRREIESVHRDHEVAIVAKAEPVTRYDDHLPYTVEADPDAVCELVEDFRPDVLHTHWLFEAPTASYIAQRTGVPYTIRTHGFDTQWGGIRGKLFNLLPGRPFSRLAPPRMLSAARLTRDDACIGVIGFPFVCRRLEKLGVPEEKIRHCYPVVDVQRFLDYGTNGDAVMNCGPALREKAFDDFIRLAATLPDQPFTLYAFDYATDALKRDAARSAGSVTIPGPIDHDDMPAEYKKHKWLVKTGDIERRVMGWPVSIAEAQASGVGVCMANLGRDLKEYLGPGGFLFDSIAEAKAIISKPFPEELRDAGFEQAKKSDIAKHRSILIDLWHPAFRNRRMTSKQTSR